MESSSIVKYRTVSITVYPWRHASGATYYQFRHDGHKITRNTLEKAKKKALEIARQTFRGQLDLADLTPEQTARIKRMLEIDPELARLDEYETWLKRRSPKKNTGEAIDEFLAIKEANRGLSKHNVNNLTRYLSVLPRDKFLETITPRDLPKLTGAPRTRANARSAWVTFFRWCVNQEYLPHGEKTAAERIERPIITAGVPETYTADELRVLLGGVSDRYRPWLVLMAFAALRTEEIIPQQGSNKSPLAWEDILWDRDIIIVRPETAKTKRRRVIPIQPVLKSWLHPVAKSGTIGPHLYPSKPSTHGSLSETTRLGKLIGGWKRNALRHSYISYRAAIVGLAQTAMEAGNSESEARRSYNDAKSRAEAEAWFSVFP